MYDYGVERIAPYDKSMNENKWDAFWNYYWRWEIDGEIIGDGNMHENIVLCSLFQGMNVRGAKMVDIKTCSCQLYSMKVNVRYDRKM